MRTLYSCTGILQTRRIRLAGQVTFVLRNPPPLKIAGLLRAARIIAIVGLSPNPSMPGNWVARQLQGFGYRITPVTPRGGPFIPGEPEGPDLDQHFAVLEPGGRVDVVNVFRRPEHVAAIVDDCIRLGIAALWLQEGVVDEPAA